MKTGSHVMRSYEEWVSIVWPDGTWRKAAEYRCHFRRPEPPPPPPPPPKTRPAKKSIDARAVDVLIRKRKWDQDRDLQRTKAFYRTFLGRGGIGINKFDETIWPQASAAPGVNPLKAGRPREEINRGIPHFEMGIPDFSAKVELPNVIVPQPFL